MMGKRGLKADKTGRSKSGEKFARMFLATMQCPAWKALSPYAQRLYPWLLLEWNGPQANNNRRLAYTVKQAIAALGCNTLTARRAFLDLQAKGFLVVTRCAALGCAGKARAHEYEVTELGTAAEPAPRKLFRAWKPGFDFPVVKAAANNPSGIGGAQNLKPRLTERDKAPRQNLESQLTGQGSIHRPQLTDDTTPNLPRKSNRA